jgi:hypothetical protein
MHPRATFPSVGQKRRWWDLLSGVPVWIPSLCCHPSRYGLSCSEASSICFRVSGRRYARRMRSTRTVSPSIKKMRITRRVMSLRRARACRGCRGTRLRGEHPGSPARRSAKDSRTASRSCSSSAKARSSLRIDARLAARHIAFV